jgi:hypothetical protein
LELKRCSRCGGSFPATPEHFVRMRRGDKVRLSAGCKPCLYRAHKQWYLKNRKSVVAKAVAETKRRRQDPKVRERERTWARERMRRLLADPLQRERHRAQVRNWFKNNRERARRMPSRTLAIRAYYTSRRNAAELRATPSWADFQKIRAIYFEAQRLTRETGIPHEVDHLVPLRHPKACGLHVAENLRVIPASENRAKSNRFITE